MTRYPSSRRAVAFTCVVLAFSFVANLDSSALGQGVSITRLASLAGEELPAAFGVSADGSTVFGEALGDPETGLQAVRWAATGSLSCMPTRFGDAIQPHASARAGSSDGSVLTGHYSEYDAEGIYLGKYAFRWNADGAVQRLGDVQLGDGDSYAEGHDVSADGAVIGGVQRRLGQSHPVIWRLAGETLHLDQANGADGTVDVVSTDGTQVAGTVRIYDENGEAIADQPSRWNLLGEGRQRLETFGESAEGASFGTVEELSADGRIAVGSAQRYSSGESDGLLATLWDAEGTPLHIGLGEPTFTTEEGATGPPEEYVIGCSADGTIAAGYGWINFSADQRAFVWTETDGAVALPTLAGEGAQGPIGSTVPRAISADGRTIVGFSTPDEAAVGQGGAFLCRDGEMRSLWNVLVEAGCDPAENWSSLDDATFCSADGSVVVGIGTTLVGVQALFRVAFERNEPPTIEGPGDLPTDETVVVRLGQTFEAAFTGDDPDGDDLTLNVTGLPESATVDPASGESRSSPFAATIEYVPTEDDVQAQPYDVTVAFVDESGEEASFDFKIRTPANRLPTIAPPAPVAVECEGDVNLVTLAAKIGDADSHQRLTVTWYVDGIEAESFENVVPGTTVELEHDFPDDESDVEIVATDGYDEARAGTTVTVRDTTAPTIVVANDVVVSTDLDEDFATNVVLTRPEVFDLCDGEPTLSNNALARFRLGDTIVKWTAVDADGNRSTANQKVTVEDRQAPTIVGGDDVSVPVDRGEVFAAVDLPEPDAFDNVPNGLTLEGDPPETFPIGVTPVTWTAIDAAGNEATWTLNVTVVNAYPVASAGADVTIADAPDEGVEVTLDAAGSSDPDGHSLEFAWSAPGIRFDDPTKKRATATFPVGETRVTLIVVDEGSLATSDSVTVTIVANDDEPGEPTTKRRFVIDRRSNGKSAGYYTGEAVWRCGGLPSIESSNVYLLYAAYFAQYAAAFDAYAKAVDYRGDAAYRAALDDYLDWRNWQTQYSYATAIYLYYGLVTTSGPAYVYYDYVGAAYSATSNAVSYGSADLQAK